MLPIDIVGVVLAKRRPRRDAGHQDRRAKDAQVMVIDLIGEAGITRTIRTGHRPDIEGFAIGKDNALPCDHDP